MSCSVLLGAVTKKHFLFSTQTAPTKKGKLRDRDPRPSAAVGSVGTVALSARTRAPHCHGDRCDRCAPFATLQRAPSQTEMALERVDTGECCTHTHPMTCSSNVGLTATETGATARRLCARYALRMPRCGCTPRESDCRPRLRLRFPVDPVTDGGSARRLLRAASARVGRRDRTIIAASWSRLAGGSATQPRRDLSGTILRFTGSCNLLVGAYF